MSIKKLIALITAFAVIVTSFNTLAFAQVQLYADDANVQVGTTIYTAGELKGTYTLTGTATDAKYKWYSSDSIVGEYSEIFGENEITLKADKYNGGEYIRFAVIPVDADGTEGDIAYANPVYTNLPFEEDFESANSSDNLEEEVFNSSTGEYGIVSDPADGGNNVFMLKRTSTSTDSANKLHQTRLKYNLPDFGQPSSVRISADIYAGSDWSNTWETLYIMGTNNSGSAAQIAKFTLSGSTLKFDGKSTKTIITNFQKEKWYTIETVLDFANDKVVSYSVNGETTVANIDFIKSANIKSVDFLRTFLQQANTGSVYVDNISVTAVGDTTGFAKSDLDAIDVEAVIPFDVQTVDLPSVGGEYGAPIGWTSSDESLVKIENGNVALIDRTGVSKNTEVVLTAHCANGNDYSQKEFTYTVICEKASDSSIDEIEIDENEKIYQNFDLVCELSGGEAVTWASSDTDVISIEAGKAIVKQTYTEASVVLTASAVINGVTCEKEFHLTVAAKSLDNITPPIINAVSITQKSGRRPVNATYDYYDYGAYDEVDSVLQWYVYEDGEYVAVKGENQLTFVPGSEYGGKKIRFGIKPVNELGVEGKEYFSEPLTYKYFKAANPVGTINKKTINADGAFEISYSYSSFDLIKEGDTSVVWYKSDRYDGEYVPVNNGASVYKPDDINAFYKYVVTVKDAEGNSGDTVQVGPFMYTDPNTNQIVTTKNAIIALSLPLETCLDVNLPKNTDEGATYAWVSSDDAVMNSQGKIFRDSKEGTNKQVTLTVYAVCGFVTETATFNIQVNKFTNKPVVINQKLVQKNRPLFVEYTYTDEDNNPEGKTTYEWYYKAKDSDDFVLLNDVSINRFAPTEDMSGGVFKVRITPCDSTYTIGDYVETPEFEYVYKPSTKPGAKTEQTLYNTYYFTGRYKYTNADGLPEGKSQYKWYYCDKMFGDYVEIEESNVKVLPYDKAPAGTYLKFAVTPVDSEGTAGDEVLADPVLVASPDEDTFDDESSLSNIDTTSFAVGSGNYAIVPDPLDSTNNVLKIERTVSTDTTDTNNELKMSMLEYNVPNTRNTIGVIIDADVYVDPEFQGTWELMYVMGASQAFKIYTGNNNNHMYFQGDNSKSALSVRNGLTKGKWHHIRIILDLQEQLVKEVSVDGTVGGTDMDLRSTISSVDRIRTYIQTTSTGAGYIDNLSVTPVVNAENYAREDANMIVLDTQTDAVINNIRLPIKGGINGSAITWTSSDENYVVIEDGRRAMVTRPANEEGDKKVTLTAHVIYGNDYYTRDIQLNIVRELGDEDIVARDYDNLSEYDNMISDTTINFPDTGRFGAKYEWISLDETIVSSDGTVHQTSVKQDVAFDVKITSGNVSQMRRINITVAPVRTENLLIKGGINASSSEEKYPSSNARDDNYSTGWKSLEDDKSPFIIMDMGMYRDVNRFYVADKAKSIKSVRLSASKDKINWTDLTVTKGANGENIFVAEFESVNTRYIRADFVCDGVASANEVALMYDPTSGDNAVNGINDVVLDVGKTVKEDFTLPVKLSDGTQIQWESSDTKVISIDGSKAKVKRASSDKTVTLTATITVGGKTAEKVFTLVVKGTGDSSSSGGGGGGGSKGGGGVSSAMGVVAPAVPTPSSPPASTFFEDILSVPWAIEAINSLAEMGMINGTSATTFEPVRNITREEFAAILSRVFEFDNVAVSGTFSDVSADSWYYEPVMQLSSLGIINGIGEGTFGTGKTITRQDMAVMIYRAAKYANAQFTASGEAFADDVAIAEYAKEAVSALSGAQIVNGVGNGNFNPAGNATRAEATVILYRIINYIFR